MAFDSSKKINFVMALSGDDKVRAGVKAVNDGMWDTEKAVSLAKAAFVGLAGVAGVGALVGMVKGVLDGAAGMHDLSIQTGLSVAALGQFKSVGAFTNTTAEQIGGAMLKLAKNMATVDEDGKGAALAIKALGLDFGKFKALSPDQQMLEVAKAMANFEDGADKSAAAMMLFGKEGAKMLPFLADLADKANDITASLTDQEKAFRASQAAMADAFGDNLTKLRKDSQAWKKDLSMGLLPALYEASEAILGMANGTGGLKAKISELAKDGTLADWARGAMTALSYLVDVVQGLYSIIPMVGHAIAGLAAAAAATFGALNEAATKFDKGDYSGAWDSMKAGFESVKTVAVSAGGNIADVWGQKLLGAQFRDRMDDLKGISVQAKEARKNLDLASTLKAMEDARLAAAEAAKREAEELKKLIAEYERAEKAGDEVLSGLLRKNATMQLELDTGHALTVAQKEMIDLDEKLASGKILLSIADERAARALIISTAAIEANIKWAKDSATANAAAADAIYKERDALVDQVAKQREANAAIGATALELLGLERARLADAAAAMNQRAAMLEAIDAESAEAKALRESASALRERADLLKVGFDKRAALESAEAWKRTSESIGQTLTDALLAGPKALKDLLKRTVFDVLVRMPLQAGITGLVNSVGGALGAPGSSGGLGNLSNLLSVGNSFSDGGMLAGAGSMIFGNSAAYGAALGTTSIGAGSQAAMLAAQTGEFGAAGLAATGSAAGGAAGSLMSMLSTAAPYIAAVVALAALLDKKATPHVGGYALADAAGGVTDITRQQGGIQQAQSQTAMSELAKLSAGLLNTTARGFGGTGDYSVRSVYESDNNDPGWGLFHLLRGGAKTGNSFDALGTLNKDAGAGLAEYSGMAANALRAELKLLDLPKWAGEALDALGKSPAVADLATAVGQINTMRQALVTMGSAVADIGGPFEKIAGLSSDAKFQLAQFTGGVEAFIAKTRGYVSAYYTEGEQMAIQARNVLEQLGAAGINGVAATAKGDLRTLMESLNPNEEADRRKMAALLNVADQYAAVGAYLEKQGTTLGNLADQSPQVAALAQLQSPTQTTASATAATAASVAAVATSSAATATAVAKVADASEAAVAVSAEGFAKLLAAMTRIVDRVDQIEHHMAIAEAAP